VKLVHIVGFIMKTFRKVYLCIHWFNCRWLWTPVEMYDHSEANFACVIEQKLQKFYTPCNIINKVW